MTTEDAVPMATLAKVYIKMRAKIQEITQAYEAEVGALKEQQDAVALAMKDQMRALGSDSIKTPNGTVILSQKTRFYTQDWDSFKQFVIQNDALDLLEKRIAQGNMKTFLEENPGLVPPGLNAESEYSVTVRKPTK